MFGRVRMRLLFTVVVASALSVMVMSTSASAYRWTGMKWPSTSVKYVLSASLTSSEKSYVNRGAKTWNDAPTSWTLSPTTSDGVYSTFSKTDFSYHDWADIPGVTLVSDTNGVITKCRSYINTDYAWNNDGVTSKTQRKCDYATVILHEFGHWITLDEDTCHSSAAMWPNWITKQSLTTTDKNGLDHVY